MPRHTIHYKVVGRSPGNIHNFTGTVYDLKKEIKVEEALNVATSLLKLSVKTPDGKDDLDDLAASLRMNTLTSTHFVRLTILTAAIQYQSSSLVSNTHSVLTTHIC